MSVGIEPYSQHRDNKSEAGRGRRDDGRLVAAGVATLAIPLVVALAVTRDPHWFPVLDRAGFELRVRDAFGDHSPLVGVVGRVHGEGGQGNHPGPLAFYLMWPAYRLFGAGSWALQVASATTHLAAAALTLWLGARRGGRAMVLGLVIALLALARGVGTETLVDPWNPFLSLAWWMALLVAVWSVLDDDLLGLPVAALAGSYCAQNHAEYVPLGAALAGLVVAGLAIRVWRRRDRPDARAGLVRTFTWTALAGALGAVLWAPPILDELDRTPGNLAILRDQFTAGGGEPPIGLWRGTRALLVVADPTRLARQTVVGTYQNWGSILPSLALLAAWAAAAVVAHRAGERTLVRLHVTLAVASLAGAGVMSRITGPVWFWLGLWGAVLTVLVLLAIAWSVALCLRGRWRPQPRWGLAVAGAMALVVTVNGAHAEPSGRELSDTLGEVLPPTVAALAGGEVPGGGRHGTYLVTANDPVNLGMHAIGLVNELDRRGFRAGMETPYRATITEHRALARTDVTAVVHLSVGPDIAIWRATPGAHEVTFLDRRSDAERHEYERVRRRLIADLHVAGLHDRIPMVDTFIMSLALDPTVPAGLREEATRLMEIGLPTAVFVAPPDTAPRPTPEELAAAAESDSWNEPAPG